MSPSTHTHILNAHMPNHIWGGATHQDIFSDFLDLAFIRCTKVSTKVLTQALSHHLNTPTNAFISPLTPPLKGHVVVSSAMLATPTTRAVTPPAPLLQGVHTRAHHQPHKHSSSNLRVRWSSKSEYVENYLGRRGCNEGSWNRDQCV